MTGSRADDVDLRIAEEPVERQELLTMFVDVGTRMHVQPAALLAAIQHFSNKCDQLEFEAAVIDLMDRMQPAAAVFDTMIGDEDLDLLRTPLVVNGTYLSRASYDDPWTRRRLPLRKRAG